MSCDTVSLTPLLSKDTGLASRIGLFPNNYASVFLSPSLSRWANLDLKTQESYELAVKGLIRPMNKSPPLITAVRCLRFEPPEFQLEIHCLHENQQYLRKIIHEIGLELKTTAVCSQVRRVRDGVFVLEDALLRTEWDLPNIQRAILQAKQKVEAELHNSFAYLNAKVDGERERT